MDKNTLIIGGAIIGVGGIIAAGVALNAFEQSAISKRADDSVAQKMEEQDFKDFENEEQYSFCRGVEEIHGVYENYVFGNEVGNLKYISEDISVLDKRKNKLYILGRHIEYKYSGNAKLEYMVGQGSIDIEEDGVTTEYFSRHTAPVRIDFNAKIIYPAPERKSTNWVTKSIKSVGTAEFLDVTATEKREDAGTGDANVFCPSFNLDDVFITPLYMNIDKECPKHVPYPDIKFAGNFKFGCGAIDNAEGIEIAKEYREKEKLRQEFLDVIKKEHSEDTDPGAEFSNDPEKLRQEMLQEMLDVIQKERSEDTDPGAE